MKEEAYESVWDAIEDDPVEAASLKVRSRLLIAIQDVVDRWELPAAAAAQLEAPLDPAPARAVRAHPRAAPSRRRRRKAK